MSYDLCCVFFFLLNCHFPVQSCTGAKQVLFSLLDGNLKRHEKVMISLKSVVGTPLYSQRYLIYELSF